MIKILFVCLGNICRSPTAEGVFRQKLSQNGIRDGYLENIFVDSAGTGAYHVGKEPDRRSQEIALKYGVSLNDLKARRITLQDFTDYDYILGMDHDNIQDMKAICPPGQQYKIKLFMEYADDCPGITEVPDPYTGGIEGFDRVYDFIDRGCNGFLKYLFANNKL
ncbi:MAG: low molecular weight phosphotyrosine protein phosphatase [Emcibacter sp.]|nr:low molecular weight phosphotyrosine protein phosphatase [Emcibacter sp.]